MQRLSLSGFDFQAAVCSEDNVTGFGSKVSGLNFVNLDRMLWTEAHGDHNTISFQLDPDRWLLLTFQNDTDFKSACTRMEAIG